MTAAPPVLLPYQQRWVADKSTVKVAEKSRRIGLSWAAAAESVLEAGAAEGGQSVWYIGYNQEMAREFIADCGRWSQAFSVVAEALEELLIEDDDGDIRAYRITLASGHRITALSSRPTNLRGKQGLVILDEAAFHAQLDELLKAALALLIWGGRVAIISTHNGEENPFNELIQDIRAGKRSYSLHRITFDEALSQGLYQRICLKGGREWSQAAQDAWRAQLIKDYGDAAQEELFCIPRGGGGVWLTRALLQARSSEQTPVVRMRCPDGLELRSAEEREAWWAEWWQTHRPTLAGRVLPCPVVFGLDFARSGDLTVLPLLQQVAGRWSVRAVLELRNAPYFIQARVLEQAVGLFSRLWGGAMDARGNGQYLAENARMRWGSLVEAVMLTEGWYRDHMPPLKVALEDGTLSELPRDEDVLGDLRLLRLEKGVARIPEGARTRGQDGGMRHGDAAIALALAWHSTTQDIGPLEFRTGEDVRSGADLTDY